MSGLEEIFNPGAVDAIAYRAREKVLPAPAPVAGDPLEDAEGAVIIIPPIDDATSLPEPSEALSTFQPQN